MFDFSNLNESYELFSNTEKVFEKFKVETPKYISIEELFCLRRKNYVFKCGNDSKIKSKGIFTSYSKNIKFDEYKKSSDGSRYQKECDTYLICSINNEK